ncbi:TPA: site-specific integrase [Klebsiella pneumoniae]|nr:site-specific integrase [Klebsiella pneumoniae]HDU3767045.1 site-specific integrase [Klebsiella aerogenes]EKY1117553.1 site-specific integrase [Klebsiella pneumoniae]ELA1510379.1 site-specific integrase [Klebsiella pneumoniae]MBG1894935.1 site-specific integrase [Klebsiella pneumoniae]
MGYFMHSYSYYQHNNSLPCLSLSVDTKSLNPASHLKGDTRVTQLGYLAMSQLARPQLVRRKSGRYTVRFRMVGHTVPLISLSTRTTIRSTAVMRQNELAAAAKAFLLDKPEVSAKELREHLMTIAEGLLTEPTDDYWNGVEVAVLEDAKANLRHIAARERLTVEQQAYIAEALKVLTAGQRRVDYGDASGLLEFVASGRPSGPNSNDYDDNNHTNESTLSDAVSILKVEQGDDPVDFNRLTDSVLAEKALSLKKSSYADLRASLGSVLRYIPDGMDIMNRAEWLGVRDAMVADGLAYSTINKLLTKSKMAIDYGLMNKQLPNGRNPIERLKLTKDAESKRRAFTDDEVAALLEQVGHVDSADSVTRKWAAMLSVVTGARAAEIAHLTKRDIVTIDGITCIDINENGHHKSVKNKHSVRLVPLTTSKAIGFDVEEFLEWVSRVDCDTDAPLFGMTPAAYSHWFNRKVVREALGDVQNVSLHSLRHWLASRLKGRGVALVDAQGVLGHSSQSITFDLYGKGHAIGRLRDALQVALSGEFIQ